LLIGDMTIKLMHLRPIWDLIFFPSHYLLEGL
jgi:hypothetical protein